MVNYSCLNCQKIFKQKGHYDKHLERKTQCKKDNIIEKLVEEKIQQLLQKQKFDIFTPDLIAKEMSSHFPNKINKLLEPSIGTGNLLKYINYKKCIGYDINKTYTSEIKKAEIRIEDFILANITEKFDGVSSDFLFLEFTYIFILDIYYRLELINIV
jgi:site-specific DNA-adenine methylase